MEKIIIAYVPVLHQGYRKFFEKHASEVKKMHLFSSEIINQFSHLAKDIRALPPGLVKQAIKGWNIFEFVSIVDSEILEFIRTSRKFEIIMPDEDECREVAAKYLNGCKIEFDNVFLRWDKTKSLAVNEVKFDRNVSIKELEGEIMKCAIKESGKATNWWRQTGAVIARDDQILLMGCNRQVPSSYVPYFEGDVRSLFKRGINIELTTDLHAEAHLISEAAKKGIALEGTDLFVTTFPCPPCAKIVAYSGIKRCYFHSGYAMLDGERILRDKGIEIILVTDE